jgi:hypothetical protein
MSPPALVIRLALEQPASVYLDCLNDGEKARLFDWLNSQPDYADLVERALELAEQARAA